MHAGTARCPRHAGSESEGMPRRPLATGMPIRQTRVELRSQPIIDGLTMNTVTSQAVLLLQAHEEQYVRVLPAVGQRVKVSFYSTTCEALADYHRVLRSLLSAAAKPRQGPLCYAERILVCACLLSSPKDLSSPSSGLHASAHVKRCSCFH